MLRAGLRCTTFPAQDVRAVASLIGKRGQVKKFIATILTAFLVCFVVYAQDNTVFWNTGTTMAVVGTNSTVLFVGVCNTCPQPGGQGRTHYDLIENVWTNNIIFDFFGSVRTTNITVDGNATNIFVGHCLRPLDTYEIPAGKEYNGPISAVSTNGLQGVVALTVSHNQN